MLYARYVYKILEVLESFSDFYRSSSLAHSRSSTDAPPPGGRRIERDATGPVRGIAMRESIPRSQDAADSPTHQTSLRRTASYR